jgi:hypothetical protein
MLFAFGVPGAIIESIDALNKEEDMLPKYLYKPGTEGYAESES